MGRDFYDLIHLLAFTSPDMDYILQKLNIRGGEDLRRALLNRCASLNFNELARDLEPFLYHSGDAGKLLLFREFIEGRTL